MMSWRWLLWLIPLYLLALVVLAPARLLLLAVDEQRMPLQLSAVSGSLWQGTASVNTALPTGGELQLNGVQWQVNPWALMTGRALLTLDIPASNVLFGHAQLDVTSSTVQLNANLQGALQSAIQQLQLPVPITLAGNFELQIDDYQLHDWQSRKFCDTLSGQLTTRDTEMRLNQQWYPLGDYLTQLTCTAQNGIQAKIDDNNLVGLRLNALVNGNFAAPQVRVDGSLKPTLQTPKPVTDMLVFLGNPDAQGRYTFKW